MAERKILQVYHNWLDAMTDLTDEECGRLFRAMLSYSMTGVRPELAGNERFVFRCLSWQIDQDRAAYERKCEINRENGRRGGRPRESAPAAAPEPVPEPAPAEPTAPTPAKGGTAKQAEPTGSVFSGGKPNGGQEEQEQEQEQKQEHSPLYPPAWGDRLKRTADSWLAYKREKGQAYRPRGERILIEQIASHAERYGQEAVIRVMEESMASNYQGITWDRLEAAGQGSAQKPQYTGGPQGFPAARPAPEGYDPDYFTWMREFQQKHPMPPLTASPPGG